MIFFAKKFGSKEKIPTFAIPNENNTFETAEIAQLVEHNLAKVGVASSSLVFCSKNKKKVSRNADFTFERTSVLAISPDGVQSYASRPCAQGRLFCFHGPRTGGHHKKIPPSFFQDGMFILFNRTKAMSRTLSGNGGRSRNNCGGRGPAT